MKNALIATGKVESLSLSGKPTTRVYFKLDGPAGDNHIGMSRKLSGHDGVYRRTSSLVKGDPVFNWRTWTGLSREEVTLIERELGVTIPQGCLLENIIVSGIPSFSQLAPTSRLVFPYREDHSQVILAVWEENSPCSGVGDRLEKYHDIPRLCTRFIAAVQEKRGVMGIVLSEGFMEVGDLVEVYPPAQ